MTYKAYAKINLSLDVTGKRADGYHFLKMIMQSISLYDEILCEFMAPRGIELTTDKPYIPTDRKNIAWKAADEFIQRAGMDCGIRIHIKKHIPVAAGLAGGSTDGGAVLRILNKLAGYPLTNETLLSLGVGLGADLPFTMTGGTALCEGIGEIITPLPDFSDKTLVLVKPPFGVSTAAVFKGLDLERIKIHPDTEGLQKAIAEDDLLGVSRKLKNVLENVTLRQHGMIRKIKSELVEAGALSSAMTGSGPTVFGFFDDDHLAASAYEKMRIRNPESFLLKTISRQTVIENW